MKACGRPYFIADSTVKISAYTYPKSQIKNTHAGNGDRRRDFLRLDEHERLVLGVDP